MSWKCVNKNILTRRYVLKRSWRHLCKTSWRRLQRRLQNVLKTSWRCLEDILKTSWKRLEDALKMFLQDVLKTSWKCLEEVWPRWIYSSWSSRLEDVFWRGWRKTPSSGQMFAGINHQTKFSQNMETAEIIIRLIFESNLKLIDPFLFRLQSKRFKVTLLPS